MTFFSGASNSFKHLKHEIQGRNSFHLVEMKIDYL